MAITLLMGGPGWNSILPAHRRTFQRAGRSDGDLQVQLQSVIILARPDAPFKTFKEMLKLGQGKTPVSWSMEIQAHGARAICLGR